METNRATHGRSEVHLDSSMLHRCCSQISSSLKKERISLEAEKKILLPFVRSHAATFTNELTRALIWRVVDTAEEDPLDRAGAWELLQEVLEECGRDDFLTQTSLAEKISSFLPELISHRWFTRVPRQAAAVGAPAEDSARYSEGPLEGTGKVKSNQEDEEYLHPPQQESGAQGEKKRKDDVNMPTRDRRRRAYPSLTSTRPKEPWGTVLREGSNRKVVPAAMVNGPAGYSHLPVNAAELEDISSRYARILSGWKKIWRSDTYHELKAAVRRVSREGNYLSEKGAVLFEIPSRFRDSLWRLRRRTPRPNIAYHLLNVYGWEAKQESDQLDNFCSGTLKSSCIIPSTLKEAKDALDSHMHPTVWSWIKRLVEEKGGCLLCDTWRHQQRKCPCDALFRRPLFCPIPSSVDDSKTEPSPSGNPIPLKRCDNRGAAQSVWTPMESRLEALSYIGAVEILRRHGIGLPLRVATVLDTVTKLIIEEKVYSVDEVLLAFDRIRGAITGPLERHALWIHASYQVYPSKTVFGSGPSNDRLSPAMEKAEREFLSQRRYREWDQFLESVEVLDRVFSRGRVPEITSEAIASIRQYASFFFCLIDGSLPASYTPGRYARVPDEVLLVANMKDVLCNSCLEPFQRASRCPQCASTEEEEGKEEMKGKQLFSRPREPWDLRVARQILEAFQLLHIRLPGDEQKVQAAMKAIENDGCRATEFRQDELELAILLVHHRHVPYCRHCRMMGHTGKRCEWAAHRTLVKEGLSLVDCRLDPTKIRRAMEEYKDRIHRYRLLSKSRHPVDRRALEHEEEKERNLQEAFELLVAPYLYPPSFLTAIKELRNASIPLTAARYCTSAVRSFLFSINSSDLLEQLIPFREECFPEVCVYCDSIHHRSENCPSENAQSVAEEVHFLKELRERGLTFWKYMRCRDYYQDLLPTDYVEGREGLIGLIQQFEEDFNPGGVGRETFLKQNDLVLLTNATGAAILTSGSAVSQERAFSSSQGQGSGCGPHGENDPHSSQPTSSYLPSSAQISQFTVTSLYGMGGFSQLVKENSTSSSIAGQVPDGEALRGPRQGNGQSHELSHISSRKRSREEEEEDNDDDDDHHEGLVGDHQSYRKESGTGEDAMGMMTDVSHSEFSFVGLPLMSGT